MPSLPNANPVPMPWNSGTTAIDPNLVSDFKKSEGWEMVWNTFGPTIQLNDPGYSYYFALYNKYRGLLRFYLWQGSTPIATSFVNHGLKLYGTLNSPMLIFNAQEIADVTNKQTQFSQVLNQSINVAGGTWLAFQYDIAYDPALASTSFPAFGLEWDAKWASVSQITLNGTLTGDIKGYIGNPNASSFNFNSFLTNSATTILGASGYGMYLEALDPDPNSDKYSATVGNAVNGIVKGFFSAVMGGTSTSQPVNLTINTKIKLDGNIVTSGGIINKKLVMPGQLNSQTADGNIPHYNSTMGIMNISNTPIVHLNIGSYTLGPYDEPPYYVEYFGGDYTLDNNSFTVIWNPSIINSNSNGATIENLKIQMVQQHIPYNPIGPNGGTGGYFPVTFGGQFGGYANAVKGVLNGSYDQIEDVGNYAVVSSIPNSNIPLTIFTQTNESGLNNGVRISFDVVPNNGAPRSKIVKTFKSNVIIN